jgi:hypothetical protein
MLEFDKFTIFKAGEVAMGDKSPKDKEKRKKKQATKQDQKKQKTSTVSTVTRP